MKEIKRRESEDQLPQLARELVHEKHDGRIKLFLIYRALNRRKADRDLFEKGDYQFLQVVGAREYHVCAFARRLENRAALVAVPRFLTRLTEGPDQLPLGEKVWHDTVVAVPADGAGVRYKNVFTEEIIETADHGGVTGLLCSNLFRNFPVAFLEKVI